MNNPIVQVSHPKISVNILSDYNDLRLAVYAGIPVFWQNTGYHVKEYKAGILIHCPDTGAYFGVFRADGTGIYPVENFFTIKEN